jgi:Ca2+:H+ antiporter
VEKQSTRQSSSENQTRQRFNPFKRGRDQTPEDEDKPKKRPWYKGKILKHKPYTLRNQLQATIFNSWINILLLAAPVGIALNYAHVNGKIIFCVNFIAIIPLAGMLSFATEEIALHVGESLGGLLNASFGYAIISTNFVTLLISLVMPLN